MTPQDFNLQAVMTPIPQTVEEIESRSGLPSAVIETIIVEKLIYNHFTQQERFYLSPFCKVLGMKNNEATLKEIFYTVAQVGMVSREDCLAILFHTDSGQQIFDDLDEEERIELSGPWVNPMVKLANEQEFPRYAIKALFFSTDEQHHDTLFQKIEKARLFYGVSKEVVYEKCHGINIP